MGTEFFIYIIEKKQLGSIGVNLGPALRSFENTNMSKNELLFNAIKQSLKKRPTTLDP